MTVTVLDNRRRPIAGTTAVRLRVLDAQGVGQDVSGVYRAPNGVARIPFEIPVTAPPGASLVEVQDLTSGVEETMRFFVAARPTPAACLALTLT